MSNSEYIANRPVDIVLDEEAMRKAAMSVHGLTYKGFGVLSGNATSSLLMDYKAVCFVKFLWAVSAFLLVRLSGCF